MTPVVLVARAMAAQGGVERLRAIRSVQWIATGYRNMLEQSERPEGPYITEFQTVSEADDYVADRHRTVVAATVFPFGTSTVGTIVSDGVGMSTADQSRSAATAAQVQVARERVALSPERLLLTAASASDLMRAPGVTLQSVRQDVVTFTLDGAPVRIYLNAFTHLPTAVDYSGPLARTGYWSFLGDVTQRTLYSFWSVDKLGVRYPMQLNIESNGLPDRTLALHDLRLNGALADADFAIPDAIRTAFIDAQPPPAPSLAPATEIAPGVLLIPGAWNVTIVKLDDGIVVIEAPISNAYSRLIIEEAHRRFPGAPIRAVVTTSDSWLHFAGIREYVANGVPVYSLDLNVPVLGRNAAASYASKPDLQERLHRRPKFIPVTEPATIGAGLNRIALVPIRGEATERQMLVYFPRRRLLYGSDAFQRDGAGQFAFPQAVDEVVAAAAKAGLSVDRFYMMHIGPTGWSTLRASAAAADDH